MFGLVLSALPATAMNFTRDDDDVVEEPTTSACPTLTSAPRAYETWFNIEDMQERGYQDPADQSPWEFQTKVAQVICGAAKNSEIKIGMYFLRLLGTITDDGELGTRPESDGEAIMKAIDYVVAKRNVEVTFVLGGKGTTEQYQDVKKRVTAAGATVRWCTNGCFNLNASKVEPGSTNHEKLMTISDTTWDQGSSEATARSAANAKPIVYSSSGNWGRSQTRNYYQEASVLYNNKELFQASSDRLDAMLICATSDTKCKAKTGFATSVANYLRRDTDKKKSWVKNILVTTKGMYPVGSGGEGTAIGWAPAPRNMENYYIEQFNNVDCTVDKQIRVAMFRLTDALADRMVKALTTLRKNGCDVKLIMTSIVWTPSKSLKKKLNAAKLAWWGCSRYPMHTKLVLIGPETNNGGRILFGTANFSSGSMVWNEEHTITLDARLADDAHAKEIRRVYGDYMEAWGTIYQSAKKGC